MNRSFARLVVKHFCLHLAALVLIAVTAAGFIAAALVLSSWLTGGHTSFVPFLITLGVLVLLGTLILASFADANEELGEDK